MSNAMSRIELWMSVNGFNVHTPYDKYSVIGANNDICTVLVVQNEHDGYMVRSALIPLFDRWANSGHEVFLHSEGEVIQYLKSTYLYDAAREVISDVMDRCEIAKSHEPMFKLIDWLTSTDGYYYDVGDTGCEDGYPKESDVLGL